MFILLYTRDGRTRRHPLSPGDTIVGRAPVCDLTIDDPSISRRHVRFRVHGDHCVLTDLGGRNGTFLNGEQVTEAEVKPGDSLVLGRFPIRVDRAGVEPVVLSDDHPPLESVHTVIRRVDEPAPTRGEKRTSVDPERLLHLLSEIARQLVTWGPLAETLDRIVSVALDTIPVERAFLLLFDERTGEVVPRVVRSRDRLPVSGATVSRTVVRRAIQEKVAILVCDALVESRLAEAQSLHAGRVRSFMCTPLWNQGQVIGVLYVDNPNTAQLGAADLDILQALGSYAAVAIEQARLSERLAQEARVRERLERYHSPAVVERILAGSGGTEEAAFIAEDRDVTVLFADIVGFTRRSERMSPASVAQLLNQCFAVLCETVFAEEGMLDKFVGDAVFAVFGAPLSQPDHAARALRTAEAMREAVRKLPIDPPVTLRIALNSGVATAGDIGSPRRREYTVLGDVVNTCARLVASACEPGQIVLSASTLDRLGRNPGARPLGPVQLRGRDSAVEVFALDPR
jgi:adenylate cyclase